VGQSVAPVAGLVRITVASGTRRVDLVLPGVVPVAELVPELARSVGMLDPATAHGGYRVVTHDGRELSGDAGLTVQGVEDGGLLLVSAGAHEELPRVYDDVVEAMADVVERDLVPWHPASGRRAALAAAGLLTALGALATLTLRGQAAAGAAAGLVSLAMLAGAVVLSRVRRQADVAIGIAWAATAYAAVAGYVLAPGGRPFGLPLAVAAAGTLLCGLLALVGVAEGRPLLLPPVVSGGLVLPVGLVLDATSLDPAVVLTSALVAVVLLAGVLPRLALAAAGTSHGRPPSDTGTATDPAESGLAGIDLGAVAADARLGHQILLALSATVGLLLVLVAPLAVSLGLSGTLLAVAASLVVMLRTRHHVADSEVRTGLVAGLLGLLVAAVATLWLHPGWRPAAAGVLTVAGAGLLVTTQVSSRQSVLRARIADVVESVSLLAIPPLLVVASGLFSVVRG